MVFDRIVNGFFNLIDTLIGFLPAPIEVPQGIYDAIGYLDSSVDQVVYFFPEISVVLTILGVLITFELGILTFHAIIWVYKKIPLT